MTTAAQGRGSTVPHTSGQISFFLLGPLELRRDGEPVRLGGRKQRATLGLLLLRANEVVSTRELLHALWHGEPPTTARQILQNAVTGLRRLLPAGALVTRAPGYLLNVQEGARDLDEFRSLVERARVRASARAWELASRDLRAALAFRRGATLADLVTSGITWPELAEVEQEQLCAAEAFFEAELACGRHGEIVRELESWNRAHPRQERLCGQLMLALYRAGRQTEALGAYRRNRAVLVEELGLEPGPELRSLEQAILVHDPALASIAPPVVAADPASVERKRVSLLLIRAALEDVTGGDVERFGDLAERFAGVVRREIAHFDGTLLWADGSTCSLVFGAPRAHEDDPERAVRVALALRTRLATGEVAGVAVSVQAAVATGDALVRHPARGGEPPEVTGPAIDRCRQVVTVLPAGRIHVCDVTQRLAAVAFRFARDEGPARGWETLGVREERAPAEADEPDALPLLERDRELALLHGVLNRVRREARPHLVTVLGEPGVGKSRLVAAFAAAVRAEPDAPRILLGRTSAFGDGAALAAVTGTIMSYAGIRTTDPAGEVRRKLQESVHDLAAPEQATWLLSCLGPLLGLLDGTGAQHPAAEVGTAWRRFLEEIAARHPLIVFVEDLHWADDSLLDSLEQLAEDAAPVPLLLVATARPELVRRRAGWRAMRRGTSTLAVAPLSDGATKLLFRGLLSRHHLTDRFPCEGEFAQALLARVGGVPLFAVEYARMLRDRDRSAEPPIGSPPLPDTVQAVIATRLDALPASEKAVLQVAAVLDGGVRASVLTALGCGNRRTVSPHLDCLVERELLRRTEAGKATGEAVYAFTHALIRDVAYQQLPRDIRADLHRRAAAWLETLPLPPAELLAHHYHQAVDLAQAAGLPVHDLVRRACRVLGEAGRKAFTLRALTSAADCYEIALRLCPSDDPARPQLLLGYGKSLVHGRGSSSDSRFGENILAEARDALLAGGHLAGAGDAEINLAVEARIRGDDNAVDVHLRRALELVRDAQPGPHKAEVECAAAHTLAIQGRCDQAVELTGKVLSAGYRFDRPDLRSRARQALGIARVKRGDSGGIADLEHAVVLGEQLGMTTTDTRYNLAWAWADAGNLERRRIATVEAHEAAKRYGRPFEVTWRSVLDVIDHYWSGAWDEAIAMADQALEPAMAGQSKPMVRIAALVHAWRGRIRLARNDLAGAIADVEQAEEHSRSLVEPYWVQGVLLFRAQVALARGSSQVAGELIEQLLANGRNLTVAPDVGADLPIMLGETGHTGNALSGFAPSRWLEAAHRLLAGEYLAAADTYAQIGSRPDEARARILAARALAADDPFEAARQDRTGRALVNAMRAQRWLP